jgi:hypothetical protein
MAAEWLKFADRDSSSIEILFQVISAAMGVTTTR